MLGYGQHLVVIIIEITFNSTIISGTVSQKARPPLARWLPKVILYEHAPA
jgi:hypothetical protein